MTADDFPHKRIAKIESTMLGFDDRELFTAWVHVTYGCVAQGFGGYFLSDNYNLEKAGKWKLESLPSPRAGAFIAPLPTEDGDVFLLSELEKYPHPSQKKKKKAA